MCRAISRLTNEDSVFFVFLLRVIIFVHNFELQVCNILGGAVFRFFCSKNKILGLMEFQVLVDDRLEMQVLAHNLNVFANYRSFLNYYVSNPFGIFRFAILVRRSIF